MKDVDDLHFPRSTDAMHVDHASLHDEEALAAVARGSEEYAFLGLVRAGLRRDTLEEKRVTSRRQRLTRPHGRDRLRLIGAR